MFALCEVHASKRRNRSRRPGFLLVQWCQQVQPVAGPRTFEKRLSEGNDSFIRGRVSALLRRPRPIYRWPASCLRHNAIAPINNPPHKGLAGMTFSYCKTHTHTRTCAHEHKHSESLRGSCCRFLRCFIGASLMMMRPQR